MHLYLLLYRLRWFHAPAALLMMLLQRTPVLRVLAGGAGGDIGVLSGDLLKSGFALAALGAYNSVAGATTFNATTVSPTTATPNSGSPGTQFTASGAQDAAFSVAFNVTGAPSTSKSWKITGTLPAGLSVTNGTAVTGGYVFNGITKVIIAGTPTSAGNRTLTVSAYSSTGAVGDSASVTCVLNITGAASVAPTFTTQPSSQTVNAGANATFTVAVTGTPAPTLQWYKDNAPLNGQTSTTLSLTNVQTADAGSYKAVATNTAAPNGVSSSAATLTVNAPPAAPSFTTQPSSQTATAGGNVTFTVAVTGSPTPTIQWYKDNNPLSGKTAPTLSLTNVQAADAGTYTAVATNASAPSGVTSDAAVLTVNPAPVAPSFTTQPIPVLAPIGQTVTFTVAASGYPAPTFQWFKNNVALPGKTDATLSLANIQLADAGSYSAKAFNSSAPTGVASSAASLTVQVPAPQPVAIPRAYHVGESPAFDLSGGLSYPAGVTFVASKLPAGLSLNASTGHITGVLAAKPGSYVVTAWTQSGATRGSTVTFTIEVLPFPTAFVGRFETLVNDTAPGAAAPFPIAKVELAVTAGTGAFSGKLTTDDPKAYSFKGALGVSADQLSAGRTLVIPRARGLVPTFYTLNLALDDTGALTATLSTLDGELGVGAGSRLATNATASAYTLLLRAPTNLGSGQSWPRGDGPFTVTSSLAAVFSAKGNLGDGAKLSFASALGADRRLRVFTKPYKPGGSLAGELTLTARADNTALLHIDAAGGADVYWKKSANLKDVYHPAGFGPLALEARMEPWSALPATAFGARLGLPESGDFSVGISGEFQSNTGDPANPSLPVTLNLSPANVLTVVGANPSAWTLKFTPKTGVFTGTCFPTDKASNHRATINGVFLQPAPGETLIGGGYLAVPVQTLGQTPSTSAVEFNTP